MLEKRLLKEHLEKTTCYKCGNNMSSAKIMPITEAPLGIVAHVVCAKCQAESMITITQNGSGSTPVMSDLTAEEIKKFVSLKSITYDELLDLHLFLKDKNIWNLLHKKEKSLVNKPKASKKTAKSLQ